VTRDERFALKCCIVDQKCRNKEVVLGPKKNLPPQPNFEEYTYLDSKINPLFHDYLMFMIKKEEWTAINSPLLRRTTLSCPKNYLEGSV
jgi:hypothetical protein